MKRQSPLFPFFLSLFILIAAISPLRAQYSFYASNGSAGALTVSGTQVVNSYYHVTAMTQSSSHQITCTGAFSPAVGDLILLVQMTGGDIGAWQWVRVTTGGNPCTVNSNNLTRFDRFDPVGGIVQAITVPQYTSLTVPSGATLTASAWNGSTGGILTFTVMNNFTILPGGICDVSGLGFSGVAGGAGGAGGSGGTAGAGGASGQTGGDSLQVLYSGEGSGGNGGLIGSLGSSGAAPAIVSCPSCRTTAGAGGTNLSSYTGRGDSYVCMGGAGQAAAGGGGGAGAGGGGGGGAGGQAGTAGGAGGAGGSGGAGGNGGGAIIFLSDTLTIPTADTVFRAVGLAGTAGANASTGGAGGNGGTGGSNCNGGGGGAGAAGGAGGNGGGGGGGGAVYALLYNPCANYGAATVQTNGGQGGSGGTGGSGGSGGANGGPSNGCTGSGTGGTRSVPPDGTAGTGGAAGANGDDGGSGGSGGGAGGVVINCSLNPVTQSGRTDQAFGSNCGTPGLCTSPFCLGISGGSGDYNINPVTTTSNSCSGFGSSFGWRQNYIVYVTDNVTGCVVQFPASFTSLENIYQINNAGQTNTSCPNASDGTFSYSIYTYQNNGSCRTPYWTLTISGPAGYNYYTDNVSTPSWAATLTGLATGTYTCTVSSDGCTGQTNLVTFTILSNNTPVTGNQYDTICSGASFSWRGQSYSQSGVYADTIIGGSSGGCDSIAQLNLTVLTPITANYSNNQYGGAGCGSYGFDASPAALGLSGGSGNYSINPVITSYGCGLGNGFFGGGYGYIEYYTIYVRDNAGGCTIQFPASFIYDEDIFQLDSAGQTNASCPHSDDGTFSFHMAITQYSGGACSANWQTSITGPNSYLYTCNNNNSNGYVVLSGLVPGTYNYQINSGFGCPAIIGGSFTILSSNNTVTGNEYDAICSGASFSWRGNAYSQSGIYSDTIIGGSSGGCDSIAFLNLNILPPIAPTATYDSLIAGDTLHVGIYNHYQSGIYYDTLTSVRGCDSAVTVYLYVAPAMTFAQLFDTICQGVSIIVGGHTYTVSGTYIDTLRGYLGGDSIVTLNLMMTNAMVVNQYDTICQGASVSVGTHVYTLDGIYVDTLTNMRGCDSIHILHLTVIPTNTAVAAITVSHGPVTGGVQMDTFSVVYSGCVNPHYSWYQNIAPLGIHGPVAIVSSPVGVPDSVTCEIYCENACANVIVTSNSIHTGIASPSSVLGVSIYPNPTTGMVNMDINADEAKDAAISVSDLLGQKIMSKPVSLHAGYNREQLSLEGSAAGVYVIQLSVDGQSMYYRIILGK